MIKDKLESILGPSGLLCDQPLARYTSFRVGGPAEYMALPKDYSQAAAVMAYCYRVDLPFHILGLGTNLLVSDKGLPGVVLVIGDNLAAVSIQEGKITAQGGALLPRVSATALAGGLQGLEFAAGIPGSVGGATVMNAGAYDGEMKDVLVGVLAADQQGNLVRFNLTELELGYRSSAFQSNGYLVLEVELALVPGVPREIRAKMDDFNRRRRDKQPLDKPSAGSIFKRPPGHFAGQLIESSNLRGVKWGGAAVSDKHCGFIINAGGATAQDIYNLIRKVQVEVMKYHNVHLDPEVKIWGEFDEPS